jgi:clan AA aspartic protease
MGEVRANILLKNLEDIALFKAGIIPENKIRQLEVDALVDTGSVRILLPQDAVDKLGLEIREKITVPLANDQKVLLPRTGAFSLTVCEREMPTDALVGPPLCETLIGQLVLENLDLVINPLRRTLTPHPDSPYVPHLKMK